ncbi:class I SAM-dependent methyltransferase [Microbacterium sp. A93]|uniref:class I SAM-dependent methyltransferase n=1 Tax=Microbacterium sp. A93 TaxID=3450716 RepID=UPI003F444F7D
MSIPWGHTPDVVSSPLSAALDRIPLSRWPYPEAADLQASDAADRLLLDTAHAWWQAGHDAGAAGAAGSGRPAVAVLEDRHGALALPLVAAGHPVRLAQDALAQERSVDHNLEALRHRAPQTGLGTLTRHAFDPEGFTGAHTVLLQLPRSLDALEQWAQLIAGVAAEDVVLLAGGRDKHMTRRQNTVLERYFASVVPGRGRSKSRVLTARGPRRGLPAPFPRAADHVLPDVGPVILAAYGATFGGTQVDPGTALLLEHLGPAIHPTAGTGAGAGTGATTRAVDVGCGNGTIAVYLALAGRARANRGGGPVGVIATDQSADACASTRETARLNGVAELIEVRRDDALATFPETSEDLLVLNPPFHAGSTVDPRVALRLITESARVLRPGGELWCVWNSHLQYRSELERRVGPTRQITRNPTFTVTVSTRR